MLISTVSSKNPLIFPFFEEDITSTSRNLLKNLSRTQTRSVKSILKSASFPSSGVIPVYSSDNLVLLVHCGKRNDASSRDIREMGESISSLLKKYKIANTDIVPGSLWKNIELYTVFVEGVRFGMYEFSEYKGVLTSELKEKNPEQNIDSISVVGLEESILQKIEIQSSAIAFTKDLINTPPSVANPQYIEDKTREKFKNIKNVKISVIKEIELKKMGAGGILGVGQASDQESRFLVVEYAGGKKENAPYAFVGKGVTYDTGGLSMKPAQFMRGMKMDMGGCATVLGGLYALASTSIEKNIVVVCPLAENAVNEKAYKPDDVVTMMNGKTVEITNTDAEGRLLLGDALHYVSETFKPKSIVDMATLTGAVFYAVGEDMTAGMTNNQKLFDALQYSSERTDEPLWQLPLHTRYEKEMKSKVADLLNATIGFKAGTILAGMFLQHFVRKDTPWCHLDIASVAFDEKKGMASGRNIRLMQHFVENN